MPEHEGPPGGQRAGADDDRQHGRAADRAAEQVGDARRAALPAAWPWRGRRPPFVRLGDVPADPEDQQRRQHADEEDRRGGGVGQEEVGGARQQHADVDAVCSTAAIQGRHARPGLRQQRRPDRPFAADPQRREEPEDEQLPPGLREERQPGERGVGRDRQRQRPAAAEQVADAPEEPAAQRPADEERRLDPALFSRTASLFSAAPAVRRRRAPRRACTGACPARRTATRATPRS